MSKSPPVKSALAKGPASAAQRNVSFEASIGPVSALSERTVLPLSGFRTPFIGSTKTNNADEEGDVFGLRQFLEEELHEEGEETDFRERGVADLFDKYYDPYPAWPDDNVPLTRAQIQVLFVRLSKIFGFQGDNTKNLFDYFLRLLDSRASRMGPEKALETLHADYIGGENANYMKWYFASKMDVEDQLATDGQDTNNLCALDFQKEYPLKDSKPRWIESLKRFGPEDRVAHLAIYLLIWGEANNLRFLPEFLCFLFKTCIDCLYSLDLSKEEIPVVSESFLDHAITPLYKFYQSQLYEKVGDKVVRRDKDHAKIIGYDDINQTFWYRESLEQIVLVTEQKLFEIPAQRRYLSLDQINWSGSVRKTYHEYRSWFHALVNFNRIWIIHIGIFWYFTCFNCQSLYTKDYDITKDNRPTASATLSALSLAGSIVSGINLVSLVCECAYVPRNYPGRLPILGRFVFLLVLFVCNTAPSIYLFGFVGVENTSWPILTLTITQFVVSIFTYLYCSLRPLALLTSNHFQKEKRRFLASKFFTNSICSLKDRRALASYGMWVGIFTSKFLESYFFLTLSLKDPIRELSAIGKERCLGEEYFGSFLCEKQPYIVIALVFVSSMVLFFLDTYLWYIIWNTLFSVLRSVQCGVSRWTPWKNLFLLLPKRLEARIFNAKVLSKASEDSRSKMVSRVWNTVIVCLYRDHLLSIEHLRSLVYHYDTTDEGERVITEPPYFLENGSKENSFVGDDEAVDEDSEAARRLSFFSHTLSIPLPNPPSVESMPSFSVLVPHYEEKITLTLQEIVRKENEHSNITQLEYLKHLYPEEWHNFVRDTKILTEEREKTLSEKHRMPDDANDLPYYAVGFKAATPEFILRTRLWASLRSQTLFRTISGFMNYSRAIKLLYSTEIGDQEGLPEKEEIEKADVLAERKFRIVTSLQKLKEFDEEQNQAKEYLLRLYPELQIAYLDFDVNKKTGEKTYYSALIDGSCDILSNGQRKPKYRIRLSGNPILGDGKSDNQNNAIVFCRGEYCQLIDANQDNYLEECLKIRNLLVEFEELTAPEDPYLNLKDPVAIVGTREYIFSENVGVLGDVAAGKEQTFGTLSARTMAFVGGKLHYGHPDFLNTVFMTTRGGCSKSQKGLHLNEDIYAGINALMRNGRIKHCEYLQCGKGRDLGFNSILNFTTKIGSGMSEQILSREYFYLGTQMPLDRFLSFYYAHPGFHINNVLILLSLKLFLLFCINMGALTDAVVICSYNKRVPFTDARTPEGCQNLIPVISWMQRCIFSIFMVFGISFVPLCIQELSERGVWKCVTRLGHHFISLSPLFETFVCRVYSHSLVNDFAFGGAKYVGTGRVLSISRVPFKHLYSRFSHVSLYLAVGLFLLMLYASIVLWKFSLIYFWGTIFALLLSPFWFNPGQFSFMEFFLDYGEFLKWLTCGNVETVDDSWISHIRDLRIRNVGSKRRKKSTDPENTVANNRRPTLIGLILSQVIPALITAFLTSAAFLFANSQNGVGSGDPANSFLRLIIAAFGPIGVNLGVLIVFFLISLATGPIFDSCTKKVAGLIANLVHLLGVVDYLAFFEFLFLCENWNLSKTVLGLCAALSLQNLLFKFMETFAINRDYKSDAVNKCWWTGLWHKANLGWHVVSQPVRELLCKIVELSFFARDFLVADLLLAIQLPLLFIPCIDWLHSYLLLWMCADEILRKPTYSRRRRRTRILRTCAYFVLFCLVNAILIGAIFGPFIAVKAYGVSFDGIVPHFLSGVLQPLSPPDKQRGLRNYVPFEKSS